jgi:hypothetical protein
MMNSADGCMLVVHTVPRRQPLEEDSHVYRCISGGTASRGHQIRLLAND